MSKSLIAVSLITSLLGMTSAFAGDRTVTFAVENMSCASCPYIVKSTMAAVPGVTKVAVSFKSKQATVTFDDSKTNADAIAAASTDAGYRAQLVQQGG